jgi:hypothetical protein
MGLVDRVGFGAMAGAAFDDIAGLASSLEDRWAAVSRPTDDPGDAFDSSA